MRRHLDLTGQRFGLLTAVRVMDDRLPKSGCSLHWLCNCDCGGHRIVDAGKLRSGRATQCGCISKFATTKLSTAKPDAHIKERAQSALDYFLYQHPRAQHGNL